MDMTKTQSSDY